MQLYPAEFFLRGRHHGRLVRLSENAFNLSRYGLASGWRRDPTEDDYTCHPESETNGCTTHDVASSTAGYEKRSSLSDDHNAAHPVVVGQAKESRKWQKMQPNDHTKKLRYQVKATEAREKKCAHTSQPPFDRGIDP